MTSKSIPPIPAEPVFHPARVIKDKVGDFDVEATAAGYTISKDGETIHKCEGHEITHNDEKVVEATTCSPATNRQRAELYLINTGRWLRPN